MDSLGHPHFGGPYAARGVPHNQGSNFQQQSTSFEVWHNFFVSAKIPSDLARDYAITFSQHRIRIDMLKEITKDILMDMGIKAFGDIIAILSHAKQICSQNELKTNTGMSTTIASNVDSNRSMASNSPQLAHVTPVNAPPKPHLSQRTPITLSRGSANVSSLVGNKIPSKLNLDSGALIASSSLASTAMGDSNSSNKRPAPTHLSTAMAKRVKPTMGDRVSERTLTVHYPSRAAIEKAAQRVSGGNSNGNHHSQSSVSIKSKLGSTASHSGRGSDSFYQSAPNTNHKRHTKQRNNSTNSSTPTKNISSHGRRHDSRDRSTRARTSPDERTHRHKPVFDRLK